mmetsp:Transcript_71801/g.140850  ORF Transcript_71801/g.140850 Transcript_71801/m.140850 type:complete len:90 (-) Transcript_71801:76-345(-)
MMKVRMMATTTARMTIVTKIVIDKDEDEDINHDYDYEELRRNEKSGTSAEGNEFAETDERKSIHMHRHPYLGTRNWTLLGSSGNFLMST